MNKSYSKIRHIQKSNLLVEKRNFENKKDLILEVVSSPSTESEIKKFQDWMDKNRKFWVKDTDGRWKNLRVGPPEDPQRHVKGKGYGVFGPNTQNAWKLFGDEYSKSKPSTDDDNKVVKKDLGYPYKELYSNPTPEFIAKIIKESKGTVNDNEAWAQSAFSAIKTLDRYKKVYKILGQDPYKFIKSFMNTKITYHKDSNIPTIYDEYIKLIKQDEYVDKISKIKSDTILDSDTNKKFVDVLNKNKLSVSDSIPIFKAGQDECARFVRDFSNLSQSPGNAWIAHDNSSLGSLIYSAFHDLDDLEIKDVVDFWLQLAKKGGGVEKGPLNNQISTFVNKLVPFKIPVNLQLGDIVGIYYPSSIHNEEAMYQGGKIFFKKDAKGNYIPGENIKKGIGWGMNTHLGVVGAIKNGKPLIFHNIRGQVWADPPEALHGGGRIAWIRRPGSSPVGFEEIKSSDSTT